MTNDPSRRPETKRMTIEPSASGNVESAVRLIRLRGDRAMWDAKPEPRVEPAASAQQELVPVTAGIGSPSRTLFELEVAQAGRYSNYLDRLEKAAPIDDIGS
jgi:hypothetical protein